MTEERLTALKVLSQSILKDTDDLERSQNVLDILKKEDEFFSEIEPEKFTVEFLSAHKALACIYWERLCHLHEIEEDEAKKMLLKLVMQGFDSPENIEMAVMFSDYFCLPDSEGAIQPVPALVKKLFLRLSLEASLKDGAGEPRVTEGFKILAGAFESFRCQLETNFEEQINPLPGP